MEHEEAIRSHAAENYVSREMSPADQKDFEEHFFQCRQCADDVRFELTFAANLRAVSREQRAAHQASPAPVRGGWRERWRAWLRPRSAMAFSFAVNFALVAGLGYVLLTRVHPAARPRIVAVYFSPGPTHGGADVHVLPAGQTVYAVLFPASAATSQSVFYEMLDAAGRRERSDSMAVLPAGEASSLCLEVPIGGLPAGVHTLVVRAGPGGEVVSWSKFQT